MKPKHRVEWLDRGREPQYPPNPAYPEGIDVDLSDGAERACTVALPYPARRIGAYIVTCSTCGLRVGLTTAGRPDDPRSVRLACKAGSA
jgi:hypothetical protein